MRGNNSSVADRVIAVNKGVQSLRRTMATIGLFTGIYALLIRPRTDKHEEMEPLLKVDYAHRGFHDVAAGIPENSLAAFKRALDNGFGMELDVHLTKDGHLAVVHDSDLTRVTGQSGDVESLTMAELKQYRLGGTDEQIPEFTEVLNLIDGKAPLVVEIKVANGNYQEVTAAACRILDEYEGLFCVESFDPRSIAWLRKNRPDYIRGQLLTYLRKNGETDYSPALDFVLRNLLTNCWTRPDFIAYHIAERNNFSLRRCRQLYQVCQFDWTVRSPEDYKMVKRDGSIPIFEGFDPREIDLS